MVELDFLGPFAERFTDVTPLGSGAFGQVFKAFDRHRDMTVALKVLKDLRPMHLALFKREFRALAAVSHTHLIQIYDLLTDGDHAFFTMEFIEGQAFDTFVANAPFARDESVSATDETAAPTAHDPASERPVAATDMATDVTLAPGSTDVAGSAMATDMTLAPGSTDLAGLRAPMPPDATGPSPLAGDMATDATVGVAPASSTPIAEPSATLDVGRVDASHTLAPPGDADQFSMMSRIDDLDPGIGRGRTGSLVAPAHRAYPLCRDHERLREALRQLVRGVCALHDAGVLHRDLKPANVIIDSHGRVVILDFGLVQALFPPADTVDAHDEMIVGTPNYMSPEQALGASLTAASDWYSVGVMLYQCLTGRAPYRGTAHQMLIQRQLADPPAPSHLVPGVPADLDSLCRALIDRTASRRPDGPAILEWLGFDPNISRTVAVPLDTPFVGREAELGQIREALEYAREGHAVLTFVGGPSGIGKTTLVEQFVESEWYRGKLLVLRGRCLERENVPFKAIDGVMDALATFLAAQPRSRIERLVPRDIDALARLFPTLDQVDFIAEMSSRRPLSEEPAETRRRALRALKALIRAVTVHQKQTVLMLIDDLQWGDVDSARLINALSTAPGAPPLLVLGTYRTEEAATSECLKRLLGSDGAFHLDRDVRVIPVGALSAEDASTLAARLAEDTPGVSESTIRTIARESAGSPLFIAELLHRAFGPDQPAAAPSADADAADVRVRLDRVIADRIDALPAPTRRLLRVAAIAGRPISRALLAAVADSTSPEADGLMRLRADRLVRIRVVGQHEKIEPYHDRIRETVVASLDASDLRALHRRMADALDARAGADPEVLALHLEASGQRERACAHTRTAAVRAAEALAFDQAARLYQLTLDLGGYDPDECRVLQVALADALRNAGRAIPAAEAYLSAAAGAPEAQALQLTRKASTQLMLAGHADRGLALMHRVVEAHGMTMPRGTIHAIARVIWGRMTLWWRGRRWTERDAATIDPATLERMDLAWDCAIGMSTADEMLAGSFQVRHQVEAFESGEPYRIALALAIESMFSSMGGARRRLRTAGIARQARVLAERVDNPFARAVVSQVSSDTAWTEGRWSDTVDFAREAVEIYRTQCTGRVWEETLGQMMMLEGLKYSGRWREMVDGMVPALLDARERGDLFLETQLQTRIVPFACMVSDQPQRALDEIELATGRWAAGFHGRGAYDLIGRVLSEFYAGRLPAARARMDTGWKRFARSMMARLELLDVSVSSLRARLLIACAVNEAAPAQARTLKQVRKLARRMRRRGSAWSDALAQLVDAAADTVDEGPTLHLADRLHAAELALTASDMSHYAHACRWRRGELIGGAEGARLIADGAEWMATQGVRRADRVLTVLAPGRYTRIDRSTSARTHR